MATTLISNGAGPRTAAPAVETFDLYTTCPPFQGGDPASYLKQVCAVSRWIDRAGCKGMLVYTDNGLLDPWLVSQAVIQSTESLPPLVAVQPVYMHPYSAAKVVATLRYLYGRRLCRTMAVGGFRNALIAPTDPTPHDRRYDRLVEYTTIIQRLLAGGAVTFEGVFYRVENLTLKPQL